MSDTTGWRKVSTLKSGLLWGCTLRRESLSPDGITAWGKTKEEAVERADTILAALSSQEQHEKKLPTTHAYISDEDKNQVSYSGNLGKSDLTKSWPKLLELEAQVAQLQTRVSQLVDDGARVEKLGREKAATWLAEQKLLLQKQDALYAANEQLEAGHKSAAAAYLAAQKTSEKTWRAEVAEFEAQVQQLQAERDREYRSVEAFITANNVLEDANAALQTDLAHMQTGFNMVQAERRKLEALRGERETALEATIDRLQAERDEIQHKELAAHQVEYNALRTANAALRQALARYADHDGDCPSVAEVPQATLNAMPDDDARLAYLDSLINGCTCGFAAAFAATTPEEAKDRGFLDDLERYKIP